jgi:hypothetical protein
LIIIAGGGVSERQALVAHIGIAAFALMGGVGIWGILNGIESILHRQPVLPADLIEALSTIHRSITHLTTTVQKTQTTSGSNFDPTSLRDLMPRETLDRMTLLLEDLRELSMMNEPQRQSAYQQHVELQKHEALERVSQLIQTQQWGQADQILQRLSAQFAADPDVSRFRQQLEANRSAVQSEAFSQARKAVETNMIGSSWDQALKAAQKFADDFPNHLDGQELLDRVKRERELFRESAVGRLYHEIRTEIDNRNWRHGLDLANNLIELYPDHPRTHLIRQQFKTIQDNAEIEERQEQEVRIQELVRSHRLQEAIDLAENLIDRYPDSPQAESLEKLIPQMREMLLHDEDEAVLNKGIA